MTLVEQYHNDHKAIHQRIAAAAAAHKARKQAALVAELRVCSEPKPKPKPEPVPEPEPIEDGWVRQQIENNKPLWFSVVSATERTPSGEPTIRAIQLATCDVYGVEMNDLLSAHMHAEIVRPRMVSMYLAKELTGFSWTRIGRATGDRDHATVINAHRRIVFLCKSDEKLAGTVAEIRERLS